MHDLHFTGQVNIHQLFSEVRIQDPNVCAQRSCWFVDLREAALDLRPAEAHEFARHLGRYREPASSVDPRCRVAFLVADDLTFGNCRVLQGFLSELADLVVTRSETDARNWLVPAETG